jgi:hypothetical protein
MPEYDDAAAASFYEDPEHQKPLPGGAIRKRDHAALESHTPIRFSSSVIARVKALASEDGLTVSSWIRRLVDREIARRSPTVTVSSSGAVEPPFRSAAAHTTVASGSKRDAA